MKDKAKTLYDNNVTMKAYAFIYANITNLFLNSHNIHNNLIESKQKN